MLGLNRLWVEYGRDSGSVLDLYGVDSSGVICVSSALQPSSGVSIGNGRGCSLEDITACWCAGDLGGSRYVEAGEWLRSRVSFLRKHFHS